MEHLIGKKVYIESYGCTYNHADTQKLIAILEGQGCTRVGAEEAEAVVINTCIVIGATERHMIRRMRVFADKELYLTGCMPLARMEAIESVCSPRIILPESIRERYGSAGTPADGAVGIVQIATGCVGSCSYCITRRARGAIASESVDAVLDAVRSLAAGGAKEIQLTGQDVSAWGIDRGERLPDLLREIVTVPGRFRLRLGMMNPATVLPILDDLARAYDSEKIFRFLHLPVQSGSDAVLGRMQRGYRAADVLAVVRAFRERYPEMIISSDFIAGFPGESDAEFAESIALLREAAFAKVNITRYSRRPGTPAAREKDLTDYVRKQRSRRLLAEADRIYDGYHSRRIGTETPIVVTERKAAGSVVARSPEYMNIVIREDLPLGFEGRAVVTEKRRHYVIGRRIRDRGEHI